MRLRTLFAKFITRITKREIRRKRFSVTGGNVSFGNAAESLESRLVLYAASGNAWVNPEVISISFVPDGTNLGGVTSNLNSVFNANSGLQGVWQSEILRAAQVWSQATNINFTVVSDSGAPTGSGSYQQGSPTMGDIRIGGYDFGSSSLARAYMPAPVNNYSLSGDILFNTGTSFSVGSGYDLFTVAVHEFGHALGLDHTTSPTTAQMWSVYNGVKPSLGADDIAGIRNTYSNNAARSKDSYETLSGNQTIDNATNISGDLVRSKRNAIIGELDITTTSDVDFYKVNMPAWTAPNLVVTVQSAGLSQLAPKMTIYDKDKTTVLGTISGLNEPGTTLSLSISGVDGTDIFYIKIEGADTSPFGMGAYGITLDLGADTPPTVPLPNTTLANGNPLHSGGGIADERAESDIFDVDELTITGITPAVPTVSAVPSNGKLRTVSGTAEAGSVITVYCDGLAIGATTADEDGDWSFNWGRQVSAGTHRLTAAATNRLGNTSVQSDARVVSGR